METIQSIINRLKSYDTTFKLDDIFSNIPIMNMVFKHKEIFKLFVNYLIITHKDDIISDILQYYREFLPDEKQIDDYLFYEGKYTLINPKHLNDQQLNEVLLLNTKKTNDEYFNKVFDIIKDLDITSYDMPFSKHYLNARSQGFKFNFLKKYYEIPEIDTSNFICVPFPIEYKEDFSNAFILPYNFNNEAFKKAFYYLCSIDMKEINADTLLRVFLNFESIFVSKVVTLNSADSNLITYLYFKSGDEYIPNLRYTIDAPKIEELKHIEPMRPGGFISEVISDDKGIYFSTHDYDLPILKSRINGYINNKDYDRLLYYIFQSQLLTRSTCLFGYFVYYKLTNKIPDEKKYYDIIALTQDFETFQQSLKFKEYKLTPINVSLKNLIDFIMNNPFFHIINDKDR